MRTTALAPLVFMIAVALGASACASGADDAPTAVAPDADDAPTALAPDADGATVYAARCASCHGDDLRGTDEGPSQLSIVYEPGHHGDSSYRAAIRNGVHEHHWSFGPMPPVEDITDEQIEEVIAFIRSEQQRLGFER